MKERREQFVACLEKNGFDAAWLVKTENIRYLTGFTGEGALFVSKNRTVILTDFRYVEQASIQSPDVECLRTTRDKKEKDCLAEILRDMAIHNCGFEDKRVSVHAFRETAEAAKGFTFTPMDEYVEKQRMIKDKGELDCIIKAQSITDKAFEALLGWVHPGMTEKQVQVRLDYEMLCLGSEGPAFDTIACAGKNGSLPHAIPSDHVIEKGELLTLDFGATYKGYRSDMTRTIAIGEVSDKLKDIYNTVLNAQLLALQAIKPGVSARSIDKIARDYIDARYPEAFGHSLGHGVGLEIHEGPACSSSSDDTLAVGHVVTCEPGVYIPGVGGCRIEDMALLTEDGFIDPTASPKQLIIV